MTVNEMEKSTDTARKKPRVIRNREKRIQPYRIAAQIAFAALCIWIGIEFHFFVKYLESGGQSTFVERPPGVDGFLPISSLMSLYYFFVSGNIHPYHPAGLFILVGIVVMSFAFGKSFCSWLCPVGTISEFIADFTKRIFGRELRVPRWLDYPLRSLKYLLLGFFVWAIFIAMTTPALRAFLDSPYNLMSDVKMYYFFAEISQFALIVILVLFVLSMVIRGFWCRFLCPYGALLGLVSLVSPQKIRREADTCIDCAKCAKVCPARIKVDKVRTVVSDECTSCMQCVDACPVADTLYVHSAVTRRPISKRWVAAGIAGIFVAVTGAAMLFGNWRNDIPIKQYHRLYPNIHAFGHPTGGRDIEKLNEKTKDGTNRQSNETRSSE